MIKSLNNIALGVVVLVILILLFSFKNKGDEKYFEGIVTYNKSFEIIHPNATMDFIEGNYGTKQVLIYKNGNSKRINLNKNGDTINVLIYNAKHKRVYGTFDIKSDTIFTYSAQKNDFENYKIEKIDNQNLNDLDLEGFKLNIFYKDVDSDNILDSLSANYYYSKKYKLNAKYHEYIKDGFNNEITLQYPYIILKSIEDDNFIKIETKEMTNIEEIQIDDVEFEIDKNKILIEI